MIRSRSMRAKATMLSVLALGLAVGVALATRAASGAPPAKPGSAPHGGAPAKLAAPPNVPAAPPAPLPMLPSIPRVKIEVLKAQLVVTEEVNLPRGEWKNDNLDFYVSFGAPGAPRAVDARLVAVGDGSLEPEDEDGGEPLSVDRAPHRPVSAHALIGRDSMAGVVVHVKREALARALAPGNMAALRVRTALDLPDEDSGGARGVVVRLGASRGTPLTLGRITLAAKAGAANPSRAEARLCGSDADATPLAIGLLPKPTSASSAASAASSPSAVTPSAVTPPIAPVLAVRHATDDLCIRFWAAP